MEQVVLLLLALALGILQWRMVESLNSDGLTLLSFKLSIFSDPGRAMSDWDDSDATPCRWSGIHCSNIRGESEPRVDSMQLAKKQLVGSISPDLGSLPYLQHLNLRGNQLIGALPPAVFNSSRLQTLLLSDNDLSGSLPDSISRVADALELLDLSGNGFSGTISDSAISLCTNLQTLDLSNNRYSGSIPPGISKLTNLRKLDLSSNSFTGFIPQGLGDLSQLQGTLNLSANNLSGPIPPSLGRLPISLSIDLSFNNLSGVIPLNGTLSNQGPTAFLGNPGLCGLPLKIKCSDSQEQPATVPFPGDSSPRRPPGNRTTIIGSGEPSSKGGLSKSQVIAIAVGDSAGILLILVVISYCFYCRRSRRSSNTSVSMCAACVSAGTKDGDYSDTENNSVAVHEGLYPPSYGELLHFDQESEKMFDLDNLLRASAYVLGKGSSGIVYKAVMEGGHSVVVRRLELPSPDTSKKMIKEFESEVKAIGSIRHPNVVPLRAYYWGLNEKLLVYDFLPNGSLASALDLHQQHWMMIQQGSSQNSPADESIHPTCLTWPERLNIAKDIARGLAFLHEGTTGTRRNFHGMLKPSNILLDADRHACIADFGIGRLLEILACHDTMSSTSSLRSDVAPGNRSARSNVDASNTVDGENQTVSESSSSLSMYNAPGSIYRPPEALPYSRPTQKWDVYSFGVIVLELLTGSASAQLASSDVDMVLAVRRMLVSASSTSSTSVEGEVSEPRLSKGGSGGSTSYTTTMLMAGIRAEAEAMELLQVGLKCVSTTPEQRPKMKHVVEALNKIAPS